MKRSRAYAFSLGMLVALASVGLPRLMGQQAEVGAESGPQMSGLPALSSQPGYALEPSQISPVAPNTYIIGPDDLLAVVVSEMPELTRQVRVSSTGSILLPFFNRSLPAAGLTAPQIQSGISRELVREGLARQPQVQVSVLQIESKPIVVTGAVNRPLTLQAARPMTLLEVLSRAGGLSPAAGDTVLVSALESEGSAAVPVRYNLPELREHSPSQEPVLKGGEVVTVTEASMVYVIGSFRQPGAFPLRTDQPISVLDAIALAKGLTDSPHRAKAQIITVTAGGTHQVIPVNIDRILRHKAPDPILEAGDILYVPQDTRALLFKTGLQDAAQILTLGVAYHFPAF